MPPGCAPVELQRRVGLEEVRLAAHLDVAVALEARAAWSREGRAVGGARDDHAGFDGHAHFDTLDGVVDETLLSHLYGTRVEVVHTPQGELYVRRT